MYNPIKKFICVILSVLCLISFTACKCNSSGGSGGGSASESDYSGSSAYKPGDVINLSGKAAVVSTKGETLNAKKITIRGIDGNDYPIGGYIGPNALYRGNGYMMPSLITDEVFKKISDCGLNYLIDTKNDIARATGEQVLSLADKYKISCYMRCDDVILLDGGASVSGAEEIAAALSPVVRNHKYFAGPYGKDEPTSPLFPKIKEAYASLKTAKTIIGETAKDLTMYVNLFPRLPGESLSGGTDRDYTYEKYLADFFDCNPDYLEFDFYPITGLENTVSSGWFNYLASMNSEAISNDVAWQGFVQTGGNFPDVPNQHRITNENELNYDVNSMVCFGAKGITYFPGVFPPEWTGITPEENCNDNSLINKYGSATPTYYYAQKINKNLKAMSEYLVNSVWEGVIVSGDGVCTYSSSDQRYKMQNYKLLKSVDGDPSVIGCFNYNGGVALYVMNNTLTNHRGQITLNFDNNYEYEVIQRGITNGIIADSFTLTLEAGEGALVVVK